MARKKASKAPDDRFDPSAVWVVSDKCIVHGRRLTPGTEFRVDGERGRFLFLRHVANGEKQWIDAKSPQGQFRSFRMERVKTIHIKKRLRGNTEEES